MPTIIDKSYFTGELFVPNAVAVPDTQGNNSPTSANKLTQAIEKYERLLLVNALGKTQYDLLIAGKNDLSGKWYDLINGTDKWNGLKEIITYYVYVNYLKHETVQFTTVGLERSDAKNATSVSSTERMIEYWNMFVYMYQSGYDNCCSGIYFGSFFPFYDYPSANNEQLSLLLYLRSRQDDYNSTFFRFYQTQNVLGI